MYGNLFRGIFTPSIISNHLAQQKLPTRLANSNSWVAKLLHIISDINNEYVNIGRTEITFTNVGKKQRRQLCEQFSVTERAVVNQCLHFMPKWW